MAAPVLIKPIEGIVAYAECPLSKFTDYIFDDKKNEKYGKKDLFESWGYAIMDSEWLQAEFIRQAQEKYVSGDFVSGKSNGYGQRIDIEIELPRKDKQGTVRFYSGWMVYPDGVIRIATPYGSK